MTVSASHPTPVNVIAVPGVGLWPALFATVLGVLGADRNLVVVAEIVERPTDRLSFDAQVEFLAERCSSVGNAVMVGVSGGATLALACAMERVDGLRAIVTHEPLVGPLEPELHERVADAGLRLSADPSPSAALDFVERLYGPGWRQVPAQAERWARRHHEVVCAEVAQFASFRPDQAALRLDIPHLTTVGAESGPERKRVAALLASSGARTATIESSGHLVLVDNPAGFAEVIARFLATRPAESGFQR